jgi:hypothetical protein
MLHGKAMAIVVAYDIYLECAEGNLDEDWELDKPVDFYTFRETLARQMLAYSPKHRKYLGDDKFRSNTVVAKSKRARSPVPTVAADGTLTATTAGVTASTLNHQDSQLRMCGFLGDMTEHFANCLTMDERGKKLTCAFCGKLAYQYCGLCNVALHKFPKEDIGDGITSCFFRYHDTGCFGLARNDFRITNKKLKEWSYPTMTEMEANKEQMKRLQAAAVVSNSSSNSNGDSDDDSEVSFTVLPTVLSTRFPAL